MTLRSLLLIVVSSVICACGSRGPEERAWTEEVLLPDGRTVTVQRSELLERHRSWSGDASLVRRLDARISFTGDLASLAQWSQPLIAMVLYEDVGNKQWVIVARTSDCDVWVRRGKPKPPYWEFRLFNDEWREVPLSSSSIGLQANLANVTLLDDETYVSTQARQALVNERRPDRPYAEVWGDPDQYLCGEGNPSK